MIGIQVFGEERRDNALQSIGKKKDKMIVIEACLYWFLVRGWPSHRSTIFQKSGVRNSAGLIVRAIRNQCFIIE
jgi:hypothetical protein